MMIRVLIILVVLAFIISFLIYQFAYRRVKANEIWVWQTDSGTVQLAFPGEMAFVWPTQYKVLPLDLMTLPIELNAVATADQEIINIRAKADIGFMPDENAIQQAMTRLPALRPEDALQAADPLVHEGLQMAVANITLSQLRKPSAHEPIRQALHQTLLPFGLTIDKLTIQQID